MAIITISRGSYSKGREVAEKVAERLSYKVVSRDVLLEASEHYHIPEVKLVRAIHDAPSVLDRLTHGKQCYIAYIQSALAERAKDDNLVYHGLAGHLLLKGVPHVLKVRIIADLDARARAEAEREGINPAEARTLLARDDAERRKWTQSLYGVDPWDAALYDLVIHVDKLTTDDAADFVVQAAKRDCFRTTPEAQRKMDDLALACRIKAALVREECFEVGVTSEYGNVVIYAKSAAGLASRQLDKVEVIRRNHPEINNLEVLGGLPFPPAAV
ncbi:MAG: cytidylate kinase-like family protein [Deltaproteobacteria bacterium]|nr:cytidylate kinase-like family protein [Deltaproteobacteria bacterium]